MQLNVLRLGHFGKFQEKEFNLEPGLNLIYGENEAGKSTLHTFLKGMLFGIDRARGRAARDDAYVKYQPWATPGAFQGSMDFSHGGKEYRIFRVFYQKEKSCTLFDLETGREIALPGGKITGLIPELTESTFRNTVGVEQLRTKTDNELAETMRNYVANLSLAKSNEVDVTKALTALSAIKKDLEASLSNQEIEQLEQDLEICLAKERRLDQLSVEMKELKEELRILDQNKKDMETSKEARRLNELEQLPVMIEKYHSYQDITLRMKEYGEKRDSCRRQMDALPHSEEDLNMLLGDLDRIEHLKYKQQEIEERLLQYPAVYEQEESKKISWIQVALLLPGMILCLISYERWTPGIFAGVACILFCFVPGLFRMLRNREKKKQVLKLLDENERLREADLDLLAHYKFEEQEKLLEYGCSSVEEMRDIVSEKRREETELEHLLARETDYLDEILKLRERGDALGQELSLFIQKFMPDRGEYEFEHCLYELKQQFISGKERFLAVRAGVEREWKECSLRLERLRWEWKQDEDNELHLLSYRAKLDLALQKKEEVGQELAAVNLAIQTIKSLSADIHDSFGKKLNKMVSEIVSEITRGRYQDVILNEALEIKIMNGMDYVGIEKLSTGTMEQIYLALRLSAAGLFFGGLPVPLLLDDSFAAYDENRVREALIYLMQRERQILLFTCHKREGEILSSLGVEYNHIVLG